MKNKREMKSSVDLRFFPIKVSNNEVGTITS